jgi:hypothetical protein
MDSQSSTTASSPQEKYAKISPAATECMIPKVYKDYVLAGLVLTVIVVAGLIGVLVWALLHKGKCSCKKCRKKCCPSV